MRWDQLKLSYDFAGATSLKLHDGTLVPSPEFEEAQPHIEKDLGVYLTDVIETDKAIGLHNSEVDKVRSSLTSDVKKRLKEIAQVTDDATLADSVYMGNIMSYVEPNWFGFLTQESTRTIEEAVSQIADLATWKAGAVVQVADTRVYISGHMVARVSSNESYEKLASAVHKLITDLAILRKISELRKERNETQTKLERKLSSHSVKVWEIRKSLVSRDGYRKRYKCCPKKPKLLFWA